MFLTRCGHSRVKGLDLFAHDPVRAGNAYEMHTALPFKDCRRELPTCRQPDCPSHTLAHLHTLRISQQGKAEAVALHRRLRRPPQKVQA